MLVGKWLIVDLVIAIQPGPHPARDTRRKNGSLFIVIGDIISAGLYWQSAMKYLLQQRYRFFLYPHLLS